MEMSACAIYSAICPYPICSFFPFSSYFPTRSWPKNSSISYCSLVWEKIYFILIFINRLLITYFMTICSAYCADFSEPDSVRVRPLLVLKATDCQQNSDGVRRWSIYKTCIVEFHRPGCSWFPDCLSLDGLTPWKFWLHHWLCWNFLRSCWGLTFHPYALLRNTPFPC